MRSTHPQFAKEKWNIVQLTIIDHIRAHLLLYQITQHIKTLLALAYTFDVKVKKIKTNFTEKEINYVVNIKKNLRNNLEHKKLLSEALQGKPISQKHRKALQEAALKRFKNPEQIKALSNTIKKAYKENSTYQKNLSNSLKKAYRENPALHKMHEITFSIERRKKISEARKKDGNLSMGNHGRWHLARGIWNPNCKLCFEVV